MLLTLHCKECGNEIKRDSSDSSVPASCPKCGSRVDLPVVSFGPGTVIRGFRIERKLGQGAMGVVYLATQLAMNRKVALKILPPAITGDANLVHRFLREVQMLARIEHPNIVTAFDAGAEGGVYYLAMTYVDGEDLERRLKAAGKMEEREALEITRKVAEALAYAWDEHRILHNDIKPGNIVIDSRGHVKLMDLGLSRTVLEDSSMSMTSTAFGTPNYMSPEQAQGAKDLDLRSDQYALGATLYRLITGVLPHSATSVVELLTKKLFEPVEPPRLHAPDLSDACEHFMEVLMAKDRNRRYDTWQALIADLDRVVRGESPLAPRPAAGESTIGLDAGPLLTAPASTQPRKPPAPKIIKIQPKDAAPDTQALSDTQHIEESPGKRSPGRAVLVLAVLAAVAAVGVWMFVAQSVAPVSEPAHPPRKASRPAAQAPVRDLAWSDDFAGPGPAFNAADWRTVTAPLRDNGEAVLTGPAMEWGAEGLVGSVRKPIPVAAKGAVEATITVRRIDVLACDPDYPNAGYFDFMLSTDPARTAYVSDAPLALIRVQRMTNGATMFQVGVKRAAAIANTDPFWVEKLTAIPGVQAGEPLRIGLVVSADNVRVTLGQNEKVLLQRLYYATFPAPFVTAGVAPSFYAANQGKGRIRATVDDFRIRPVETAYLLQAKP